jgi:hypothetical protein
MISDINPNANIAALSEAPDDREASGRHKVTHCSTFPDLDAVRVV